LELILADLAHLNEGNGLVAGCAAIDATMSDGRDCLDAFDIGDCMKRILLVSVIAVAFSGGFLAGQEKPDFSGTWKLATEAADMFTSPQLTVTNDAKTMTVTSTGQMGEFKTTYSLDGTEAKSPIEFNGNTIDRVTKTSWDGGKLLLTVTSNFNGQAFETKSVWSLAADGALLVEVTRPDFQGGGAPVTSKATYKKN
jgi:hypothetical protein